jgi:alkylation response protein AidB-like acyl-CoA dehydrogenase
MHFAFDERQLEFRAQLRALTDKTCTPADVRHAWASELGWSRARWAALADMGVVGLGVPEAHGGLGLGLFDVVLLLEEAGRAGLPEPLLETSALAVPLLRDAPGDRAGEVGAQWLPLVASGEAVLTVGVSRMAAIPAAAGADLLLLEHDGALHAVEASSVSLLARPALDGAQRPAQVTWEPSPATLLVPAAEAHVVLGRLGDRAAMGTGAVLLGVADRLIAMTATYATGRTQFGHPIGSFQAVKHHLANALVRLEFARPAVYRAAWSLDTDDPAASWHASMAKALAAEAASLAARIALQVHGAIGYTWEHDAHLWMKRAWSLTAAWGDAALHRARVLGALLDGAPG